MAVGKQRSGRQLSPWRAAACSRPDQTLPRAGVLRGTRPRAAARPGRGAQNQGRPVSEHRDPELIAAFEIERTVETEPIK